MKVALNATSLLNNHTGIGRYTYELASRLRADPNIDARFFYGAVWSDSLLERPPLATRNLLPLIRRFVPYSYQIREQIQKQRFQMSGSLRTVDLYHEPNIVSYETDVPTVVTVHDISWVHFPEFHPKERVRFLEKKFTNSLARASHVITDSTFVKNELTTRFNIPSGKITAIGLGADSSFVPKKPAQHRQALADYALENKMYFLMVGTLEPRKNYFTAIRAYLKLPWGIREKYPLVHIGGRGWLDHADKKLLDDFAASGQIRLLGYLQQSELAMLIDAAHTLVFPSIYEGFGLPVLEAMHCGVPVIGSNSSSIPEVLGMGGILVDPYDQKGFTSAMLELVEDNALYQSLSNAAYEQSKSFSWERCYRKTLDVYAKVLA